MNDATTANDTPICFPDKEKRDALTLEFYRLAARLTRARVLSITSSMRLMRLMNRERRSTEQKQRALPELVFSILVGIENGTLKKREHFVRLKGDCVAVHLRSVASALFRAGHGRFVAGQMQSLFHFGSLHFENVVRSRSARMTFGREEVRRRAVILHVPSAWEFVGDYRKPVPLR